MNYHKIPLKEKNVIEAKTNKDKAFKQKYNSIRRKMALQVEAATAVDAFTLAKQNYVNAVRIAAGSVKWDEDFKSNAEILASSEFPALRGFVDELLFAAAGTESFSGHDQVNECVQQLLEWSAECCNDDAKAAEAMVQKMWKAATTPLGVAGEKDAVDTVAAVWKTTVKKRPATAIAEGLACAKASEAIAKKRRIDAMPQAGLALHRRWMHEQFADGKSYYQVWKMFTKARNHLFPPGVTYRPDKNKVKREYAKWKKGTASEGRREPLTSAIKDDIPDTGTKNLRAVALKHNKPLGSIKKVSAAKGLKTDEECVDNILEALHKEESKSFSSSLGKQLPPLPDKRQAKELQKVFGQECVENDTWKELLWMFLGAWTHCTHCGRRRANGELKPNWLKPGRACVEKCCKGGCDPEPEEFDIGDGALRGEPNEKRMRYYITPQRHHWPVYDPTLKEYVLRERDAPGIDKRESMLELDPGVAELLSIVDINMDVNALDKKDGNGSAEIVSSKDMHVGKTYNLKKTGVVKASWRHKDVESQLKTPIAQAAYRWLYKHNATYQKYIGIHKRMLKDCK